MNEIELRLRAHGGILDRRQHRDIAGSVDRLLRNGVLVALLPGIYCAAREVEDRYVQMRAALAWAGPDAVLTGRSAARLTFWPDCPSPTIDITHSRANTPVTRVTLALPSQSKRSRGGFEVECRRIPAELVRCYRGMAVTAPALTAVDLAADMSGGDVIDRALRSRSATLAEMHQAFHLQPRRTGNPARAALLRDSRDEPWSEAERLQHRLLRAAGISGWRTNVAVQVGKVGYIADVLFERCRLVLEIDGWETHGTRQAFEYDRVRRNELVLAGYVVLNFTWRQLADDPTWVIACIRQALR
ncbi:MAG: hypothetical protein AVDCRST_MAG75-448 [uncultured Propionibacteriaceae bacterium]|uniref:DUF559 domain-containing protein n=1 Tax=uncultured Propionibacteriaceae bacterium TaxID=257457 RepID=A0A6J4N196_9ACTN|nr:MAG: hypothetical protein AVDCRST_MAG75-448 [uncultured Propionibacteriaceae bacterium]